MVPLGETFVGRERELGRIDAALEAIESGSAGSVAIEGEPGIGKSRLLAELRERAEARGHIVLHGQAAEFERDRPFGVFVETFDPYLESQLENGLAAAPEELREELGAIFPAMRSEKGTVAAIGDERYRSHRAVRSLLEALAENKPLVIALDDLHWADDATIELIGALLRRGPDAPVLIVLAFRPGSAPENLTAALAAPLTTRVEVDHLSEEEAGALLADLDDASRAAIFRHGGGNPFYLEQLARLDRPLTLEGDGPAPEPGGVPTGVAASLAEEIASLSADGRGLLEAAAVAGEPFDPGVAGEIAELGEATALSALDELLGRELVRPDRRPEALHLPPPACAAQRLRDDRRRLPARRPRPRRRERWPRAERPPTERAHHVEQAAERGDSDAIEVLLEAADAAAGRAPAVAARWLEGALRLLPDEEGERQVSVRIALSSAQRSTGELERCRETLIETIGLVGEDDEAERLRADRLVRRRRALARPSRGRTPTPDPSLGRAGRPRKRRGRRPADRAGDRRPLHARLRADPGDGAGALEAARALDRPALTAIAAAALALGEATEGRIEPAREHHREAVELLDRLTDAELAPHLDAFYYIAWVEIYLERYDDALAHIDRGIEIARAAGEGRLLIPLMLSKGYPLEMKGRSR